MEQPKPGKPEAHVGSSPHRIAALADGIFAVAMTLLVLDLHVPELGEHATEAELISALGDLVPRILGFASGFVILGTLWIGHHLQFHYIRRSSRALLWINLCFLLVISSLPFFVALVGTYGSTHIACVLYGAASFLAMTLLLVQWRYAAGPTRRLVDGDVPPSVTAGLRNRVVMGMVGYGGGALLGLVVPRASLAVYVVTPLLYLLPARFDRDVRTDGPAGTEE
ncbi:MAG TPA: TMEM175 family protein [Kofleriaceae bacterium]|nr:TMEM175 family protein [Kofleriaceae bacterium]